MCYDFVRVLDGMNFNSRTRSLNVSRTRSLPMTFSSGKDRIILVTSLLE